jgi:hypothetical protein
MRQRERRSVAAWWAGYRERRAARRELTAERRARGSKPGNVLADAPHEMDADHWGGGGGFSTEPSKKLGHTDD